MNRRAFLKWFASTSAVVLVAPSMVITPTVEPATLYWTGPLTFEGMTLVYDTDASNTIYYLDPQYGPRQIGPFR